MFPDATLKIYITATAEIRGARRSAETGEELHDVIAAIRERDHRDKNRDAAPLTAASGSIRVDTSERPVDEIVDEILELLKERL